MEPRIFISRSRERSESFVEIVKSCSQSVFCESLIDFSIIQSAGLPNNGWLFFYSQTGVDFFLKQHAISEIESKGLKVAAFGPKTGKYLSEMALKPNFVGTGESDSTANKFLQEVEAKKVCFIKGTSSKDSLRPLFINDMDISEIEVYNNQAKSQIDIPVSDILVFTSPLNLETYYKHYPALPTSTLR